jgi:hypothetical protein
LPGGGVELKAERRKPSGEKHCVIEDIPSLTGVLVHFLSSLLSPNGGRRKKPRSSASVAANLGPDGIKPTEAQKARWPLSKPTVGLAPAGVELEAERRKPSGEKHCVIEDIPSLTGVLAHFR